MKFLVIGTKKDKASRNILMNLMDLKGVDLYILEEEMLEERNIDSEKIRSFDFIIFASKHKSDKQEKIFSIHAPGNWAEIFGGGKKGKVCFSSALFQKHLFEVLNSKKKETQLEKYKITLEATHHGPLIDKPCVFIEIGSSEEEWEDRRASFFIARVIKEAIETFKPLDYREVAIGIGGSHYCSSFNKIQLNSNIAISHIIPKYINHISEEMILEAIRKTTEEVDFVLLDWDNFSNDLEREKVTRILSKNYISWKKVSDIKK